MNYLGPRRALLSGSPSGFFNYYIDSVNGSDANSGMGRAQAWKTLAPLLALSTIPLGMKVGLARGSIFRPAVSVVMPWSGTSEHPIVFDAYGSVDQPMPSIRGSTAVSSGSWTLVTGTEYKLATAVSAGGRPFIYWDPNSGSGQQGSVSQVVQQLALGTAGSLTANQYQITGGFLNVNIGRAPTAADFFEVAQVNTMTCNRSFITFRNIDWRYSLNDCIQIASGTAADSITIQNCELSYCQGGLVHPTVNPGTNVVVDSCYLHDQYGTQNAIAFHVASSGVVKNCTIRRVSGYGFTCSDTSNTMLYNCLFDGASWFMVNDGAGGGTHNYWRNRIVNEWPEASAAQQAFFIDTSVTAATVINVYNNSWARGTGSTSLRGIRRANGNCKWRNNSIWGTWQFCLYDSNVGVGAQDSDYMAVGGASSLNYLAWLVGTHDVALAADPYKNVAANDLSPGVASPLIAAGVAISGITTGTPPDIGYTGAG